MNNNIPFGLNPNMMLPYQTYPDTNQGYVPATSIEERLKNIENRLTNLEKKINKETNYTDYQTNFHMI